MKHSVRLIFIVLFLSVLLITGCGSDKSSSNPDPTNPDVIDNPEQETGSFNGAKAIQSTGDLPECGTSGKGELYVIIETGNFYFCDGDNYQTIDLRGAQGVAGQDGVGQDGAQGIAGQDGINGLSLNWLGSLDDFPASASLNDSFFHSINRIAYIFNGSWTILAISPKGSVIRSTVLNDTDQCISGSGLQIDLGIDENFNQILDDDEIQTTEIICHGVNGIDGSDGYNSSVQSVDILPGDDNCEFGGVKITFYFDFDSNNSPSSDEIQGVSFVCHGEPGISGDSGTAGIYNVEIASNSDYNLGFYSPYTYNNIMLYTGLSTTGKYKLYQHNGVSVESISSGTSDYDNNLFNGGTCCFTEFNSKLFFQGYTVNGTGQMYEYDNGEIKSINKGTSDYVSGFSSGITNNSNLYFIGKDSDGDSKVFVFDGTAIADVNTGSSDYISGFSSPIIYNSNIYFFGKDSSSVTKIYEIDGTIIHNLDIGSSEYLYNSSRTITPVLCNSKLYFYGRFDSSSDDIKLFEYNGVQISDLSPGVSEYLSTPDNNNTSDPVVHDNKVYYYGKFDSFSTDLKLFEYDGAQINDLDVGASDFVSVGEDNQTIPVIYNSNLFFYGNNGSYDGVLYEVIETEIQNLNTGALDIVWQGGSSELKISGSELYFIKGSGESLVLYSYNGVLVTDTGLRDIHSFENSIEFQSEIYLSGITKWLYCSDGNAVIADSSAYYSGGFSSPVQYNNNLYFYGDNSLLYQFDGTSIKAFYDPIDSNYMSGFETPFEFDSKLFFSGTNKHRSGSGGNDIMYYIDN